MKNLADLTLELSNQLSGLEKRCRRELASAERERDRALVAGGAKRVLSRYQKELDEAKQSQLASLESADEVRGRTILKAEDKRRGDLLKEERKYRAARKKATNKKRDQIQKARKKWRDAMLKARRTSLIEQRGLRKAADEALERAIEDARDAHTFAIEDGRLAYRVAVQDDLVDERLAVDSARRKADRSMIGATIAYERAVAHAETTMRRELQAHPEARLAQLAHDGKTSEIRQACERDKEAVFRKFTRERRQLTKRRLKRRSKK